MTKASSRLINLSLCLLIVASTIPSIIGGKTSTDQTSTDKNTGIALCKNDKVYAYLTPKNMVYPKDEGPDKAYGPCYCRTGNQGPDILMLTCLDRGPLGSEVVKCSSNQDCSTTTTNLTQPPSTPRDYRNGSTHVVTTALRFLPIVIGLVWWLV